MFSPCVFCVLPCVTSTFTVSKLARIIKQASRVGVCEKAFTPVHWRQVGLSCIKWRSTFFYIFSCVRRSVGSWSSGWTAAAPTTQLIFYHHIENLFNCWHCQSWWQDLLPGGPYAPGFLTLVRVSWHFICHLCLCYIVLIFFFFILSVVYFYYILCQINTFEVEVEKNCTCKSSNWIISIDRWTLWTDNLIPV